MIQQNAAARERVWELYARSYDRILPLMPYYREVVQRHFEAVTSVGDGPIIDIACGTGNLVEPLIAAGRTVVAVDNSPAMLARLRSKSLLADREGNGLTVLAASAEELDMPADGSFAAASILLALFDMDDPRKALEHAIRLIRPGGVLVITELKRCFRIEPILDACRREIETLGRVEELSPDLDRVVRANEALSPATHTRLHAEDVYELLVEFGFQNVTFRDSHFGQCATVQGSKR